MLEKNYFKIRTAAIKPPVYLEKKNLKLEAILITHHHYDHTGGIIKLNEKWNPEVYGPKGGHIQGIKKELSEKSIIKI